MNFYELKREFDRANRSSGLDELNSYKDDWINAGWERIAEMFVIPALSKTVSFDSVADQNFYPFPYDYNGTEIALMYNNRRLDPVLGETLRLGYERRSGNRGSTKFFDWESTIGEDLLLVPDCTLTNESVTVLCASTNTILNQRYWVRFDPYLDANNVARDSDDHVNPGDYGYIIKAGSQVLGTSFTLEKPYRGPSGASFTGRIRPAETQRFITYGTPAASETDAFELTYSAKPQRLYNDSDVPEWPNMGRPIAYMASSLGLEWLHSMDLSKTFWARAVQRVQGLERRRNKSQAQVSDLTLGSTVGRRTGMRGIWVGGRWG